ncbi:galanin receptor 2b-like [Asterias amurensis]|uniref:galanin receptor 2b-like n=1 Tax=Asterias amurensis TaxID=7602 RepID=UPI003AB83FB4
MGEYLNGSVLTTSLEENVTDDVILKNTHALIGSRYQTIALKAVYAIIGTLGVFGNGLVCLIFLMQRRSFRSVTNLLILNQTVIDLFNAFIFLVLRLSPTIEKLPESILGDIICRLWVSEYIMWSLFIASTMNLVLMSLERYYATCFPVRHRYHFTAQKAKIGMLFSWLWGFVYQLYWLIIRDFKNGVCGLKWSSPTLQKIMGIFLFLLEYFIPLSAMTFSYVSIILMLRRRGADGQIVSMTFQRAKRNVTFTLCLVFFFYILCWTPTEITYFLYNLGYPYDFGSNTHMVVTVMVLLNMCVNPIIYTIKYEQFQRHLRRVFCTRCRGNRVGVVVNTVHISQNIP